MFGWSMSRSGLTRAWLGLCRGLACVVMGRWVFPICFPDSIEIQNGSQSCSQSRLRFKVGPKAVSKLEGQLKRGSNSCFVPSLPKASYFGNNFSPHLEWTFKLGNNFGTHSETQSRLGVTLGPTLIFNRVWEAVWEAVLE